MYIKEIKGKQNVAKFVLIRGKFPFLGPQINSIQAKAFIKKNTHINQPYNYNIHLNNFTVSFIAKKSQRNKYTELIIK